MGHLKKQSLTVYTLYIYDLWMRCHFESMERLWNPRHLSKLLDIYWVQEFHHNNRPNHLGFSHPQMCHVPRKSQLIINAGFRKCLVYNGQSYLDGGFLPQLLFCPLDLPKTDPKDTVGSGGWIKLGHNSMVGNGQVFNSLQTQLTVSACLLRLVYVDMFAQIR